MIFVLNTQQFSSFGYSCKTKQSHCNEGFQTQLSIINSMSWSFNKVFTVLVQSTSWSFPVIVINIWLSIEVSGYLLLLWITFIFSRNTSAFKSRNTNQENQSISLCSLPPKCQELRGMKLCSCGSSEVTAGKDHRENCLTTHWTV